MQPAHIEDMDRFFFVILLISLSILILLFFPIYLKADGHYDMNGRKLAFSICLYRYLRVFGGYIATYKGGLAMHISPQKAILIPYKDINNERKRFSIMRAFRLNKLNITMETGPEYLLPSASIQTFFRVIFFVFGGKKEKIENNVWLTDGDALRITMNVSVRFNLFILLRKLISMIKEKIKQLCQKKIKNSTI